MLWTTLEIPIQISKNTYRWCFCKAKCELEYSDALKHPNRSDITTKVRGSFIIVLKRRNIIATGTIIDLTNNVIN